MEKLQIFKNNEFGELSIIIKDEKVYIDGIQAATMLGYSNPRDAILRHCEKYGVVFHDTRVVTGKRADGSDAIKTIQRKYISEGNLYRLILKSKLPSAKKFEYWLMDEVIPSIRANGVYMNDDVIEETLNNPDFLIQMATKLKEEKEKRMAHKKRADTLEAIITLDKPYTNFAKKIEASSDSITIGQFAKLLNNNNISIGRNRLFSWFRDNGYFIKSGKDKNMPQALKERMKNFIRNQHQKKSQKLNENLEDIEAESSEYRCSKCRDLTFIVDDGVANECECRQLRQA